MTKTIYNIMREERERKGLVGDDNRPAGTVFRIQEIDPEFVSVGPGDRLTGRHPGGRNYARKWDRNRPFVDPEDLVGVSAGIESVRDGQLLVQPKDGEPCLRLFSGSEGPTDLLLNEEVAASIGEAVRDDEP